MELLNKLKYNPDNPRKIDKDSLEKLKKKIKSFPEMLEKRPIVYDENYIVLGGNQRLKVLKELVKEGFEIKDNYFASSEGWSEEKKKQFIITDNIADGFWYYQELADKWGKLPLKEWGLDITGWINEKPDENSLWEGMPEFIGIPDYDAYRSLIIHFQTEEDFISFQKLINQILTEKTKYIYYPKKEKENLKIYKYKSNES
jgi:hypothetical protein